MRSGDDIDAIDLVKAQPIDDAPELHAADWRTAPRGKALSSQHDAARLSERKVGHAILMPDRRNAERDRSYRH